MFHKGQEALCVWIQLGKGVLEREVTPQRRCRLDHIGLFSPLGGCGFNSG